MRIYYSKPPASGIVIFIFYFAGYRCKLIVKAGFVLCISVHVIRKMFNFNTSISYTAHNHSQYSLGMLQKDWF